MEKNNKEDKTPSDSDQNPKKPENKPTGMPQKIKDFFHGFLTNSIVKIILSTMLCLFIFLISIVLVPKLLDMENVNEMFSAIKTHEVRHANFSYFQGEHHIHETMSLTCIDILNRWSDSYGMKDFNIMLGIDIAGANSNAESIAMNEKNAFILTNTEALNEDIKRYYNYSYNMISTGDQVMFSSYNTSNPPSLKESPISILESLDSNIKVGISARAHSYTWNMIISMKFITRIYQSSESMYDDLENGIIQYAICPRIEATQILGLSKYQSKNNIEIIYSSIETAGPILLVSKSLKNSSEIVQSFNNFLTDINKEKSIKLMLYNSKFDLFQPGASPNEDF
ncbi:MAG: hypothetical protein KAH32_06310 [Chlamydiia bacterium]|nr:hypothetical protein [Chlamydiia bacterium]